MTESPLLTEAFRTIASIVRDFQVHGRVCRGATLKPEYLRRVPLLTEQALGFHKFGDLLRAASRAGFISVTARTGVDLEVTLPAASNEQAPALASPTAHSVLEEIGVVGDSVAVTRPIRVRPDLWRAFNSNSATYSYSRERDFASPASDVEAGDPSVVPVPSLHAKTKVWMREFVSAHQVELGPDLARVLSSARNRYEYATTLRASPALSKEWRADYLKHVLDEIQAWAVANNLTIPNLIGSFRGTATGSGDSAGAVTAPIWPTSGYVNELRTTLAEELDRRCAELLDKLIGELLQLRGLLSVAHAKRS